MAGFFEELAMLPTPVAQQPIGDARLRQGQGRAVQIQNEPIFLSRKEKNGKIEI